MTDALEAMRAAREYFGSIPKSDDRDGDETLRLYKLLDAAIKVPEGWRPIETAPKNESYLLLTEAGYLPTVGLWSIEWAKWLILDASDLPGDESYLDYCREYQYAPTHWMPLPDTPPKEGA